jgi:hypothetical protein
MFDMQQTLFEQIPYMFIIKRVVHMSPFFAKPYQIQLTQVTQLMRDC